MHNLKKKVCDFRFMSNALHVYNLRNQKKKKFKMIK